MCLRVLYISLSVSSCINIIRLPNFLCVHHMIYIYMYTIYSLYIYLSFYLYLVRFIYLSVCLDLKV